VTKNAEEQRLEEIRTGVQWRKWGPYLSERQWGTVRENYNMVGNAWEYFSHDQARSRAYRWGEDGLGGYFKPCPAVFVQEPGLVSSHGIGVANSLPSGSGNLDVQLGRQWSPLGARNARLSWVAI
jgi:hypothetical protein